MVVHVTAGGAAIADHLFGHLVDFEQVRPHIHGIGERLQRVCHEPARRPHLLDFGLGVELDHWLQPFQSLTCSTLPLYAAGAVTRAPVYPGTTACCTHWPLRI